MSTTSAIPAGSRVLVTGASGFIGTNVMHHLLGADVDVKGIDIVPPRDPALRDEVTDCDITDRAALAALVADWHPDVVLHLGARTDLDGASVHDYAANTTGTDVVLDVLSAQPTPPMLVHASSRLVFAVGHTPANDYDYQPSTAYGESKIVGEEKLRASGYPAWIIVRPTSLWGPWFATPYRNFFDSIDRGYFFHVRGIEVRKSFGYIANAVYQLDRLACLDASGQQRPYWITDYQPYRVDEWAEEIRTALGARRIRSAPLAGLRVAARVGDTAARLKLPAPLTSFRLDNLTTDVLYDASATERVAPETPTSRETGVAATVRWMRDPSAVRR